MHQILKISSWISMSIYALSVLFASFFPSGEFSGRNIKFRDNFYLHPSFDIYNTLGMHLLFKDIFIY